MAPEKPVGFLPSLSRLNKPNYPSFSLSTILSSPTLDVSSGLAPTRQYLFILRSPNRDTVSRCGLTSAK